MTNFGRMPLEMRRRTHLLRKTRNKFFEISDFRKNIVYSVNISAQTNDKILIYFRRFAVKSSRKIVWIKSQLTCSVGFFDPYGDPAFPEPRNFFDFFFFHSCKGLSRFPLDFVQKSEPSKKIFLQVFFAFFSKLVFWVSKTSFVPLFPAISSPIELKIFLVRLQVIWGEYLFFSRYLLPINIFDRLRKILRTWKTKRFSEVPNILVLLPKVFGIFQRKKTAPTIRSCYLQ